MDTKKAYDDFFQLLQEDKEQIPTLRLFDILTNYAKARLYDLIGKEIPLNIYFQEEYLHKEENASFWVPIRVNPYTNEICREKWNMSTRAFYNPEKGIFVDYSVTNNRHQRKLSGFEKVSHLIDFAFTLEHELQHVFQFENLYSNAITYDNYRMTKNVIALSYIQNQEDTLSKNFYHNAHNNLFLELDANRQAEAFLKQQIRDRGIGSKFVESFGDRKYDIDAILEKRAKEAHFGPKTVSYNLDMLFGFNNSAEKTSIDDNPEKIVDIVVDGEVRKNPAGYLKTYPILKLVYNPNGTKKTYFEIMLECKKNPKLTEIYSQIIERDPLLKIQKIEYDMTEKYCGARNNAEKDRIIDSGLSEIRKIIETEKMDIDNILIYFDKRLTEIENNQSENKSTRKLIFLAIKQSILQRSEEIKNAQTKTAKYKEELLFCRELLIKKCNFDFNDPNFREKLDNLITVLEYDHINKIYSGKGYSMAEINELIRAARKYKELVKREGYIFNSDETLASEKSHSILPGYDNLYQTIYYKKVIAKSTNFAYKASLKEEFELINQIYIESQKNVGATAVEPEHSAIVYLRTSPIMVKVLNEDPRILETLYKIREMETEQTYMTRLDATIHQCERYLNENNERQ